MTDLKSLKVPLNVIYYWYKKHTFMRDIFTSFIMSIGFIKYNVVRSIMVIALGDLVSGYFTVVETNICAPKKEL